jgi:hypothetical protein
MDIKTAREKIADKLSSEEDSKWVNILQDTSPANYGVENIELNIGIENIWVEMHLQTFTFKNAELIFSARLGGSSDENGYDQKFKIPISGNGKFQFIKNSQDLEITEFSINENLDLY